MNANQADELKTNVDRGEEIFALLAHPINEERFHIRAHLAQNRIRHDQCFPGRQWEKRFGRAGRAGIVGRHLLVGRVVKEEGEADRERETFPFRISHLEIRERPGVTRDEFEFSFDHVFKTQRAGIARADNPPGRHFEQMPVGGREPDATKLAMLRLLRRRCAITLRRVSRSTRETAQSRK